MTSRRVTIFLAVLAGAALPFVIAGSGPTPQPTRSTRIEVAEPKYKAGRVVQIGGTTYNPGAPLPNTFSPQHLFGVDKQPAPMPIEEMSNFEDCLANKTIVGIDEALPAQPNPLAEAKAKGI